MRLVDKGIVSSEVDSCDVGSVEGFSPHDKVISPCMDMELYHGEEPIILSFCPLVVNEKCAGSEESSTWVLQKVKETCLSCEGFEEELMPLLTDIEARRFQKESISSSKLANKESRELKRLSCSIDYDLKSGSSSRGRVKGGSLLGSLCSLNCCHGIKEG